MYYYMRVLQIQTGIKIFYRNE
uniref:Uncharacterized protein n=1 Tax=Anguilla anguilla TaxID=7936 RepID=A0A0E9R146_ANGAN